MALANLPKDDMNAQAPVSPSKEDAAKSTSKPTTQSAHKIDNTPGLAPLWLTEDREPGSYLVTFKSGYTLERHFAFVGPEIQNKLYRADGDDSGYGITKMMDLELLNAIRRDQNIDHVSECPTAYDEIDEDE